MNGSAENESLKAKLMYLFIFLTILEGFVGLYTVGYISPCTICSGDPTTTCPYCKGMKCHKDDCLNREIASLVTILSCSITVYYTYWASFTKKELDEYKKRTKLNAYIEKRSKDERINKLMENKRYLEKQKNKMWDEYLKAQKILRKKYEDEYYELSGDNNQ
jgi:hypothetical protein